MIRTIGHRRDPVGNLMDPSLHHQFAELDSGHWWFQGRRRVVAALLHAELGVEDDRRILDVGCGTGAMLDVLMELGAVSAMDDSPEALQYCKARFGDRLDVRCGSIPHDLPVGQPFQLVTAFDVIEHLADDLGAVQEIHRILPPGGVLVVTVPAFPFLWGPHDVLNGHYRRYRRRDLQGLLEEAGFLVERLSYFNTWLFPAVAAIRSFRRLWPRRQKAAASDFSTPPRILNRALSGLFASEARFLRTRSLPFGVSLIALGRKAGG